MIIEIGEITKCLGDTVFVMGRTEDGSIKPIKKKIGSVIIMVDSKGNKVTYISETG